MNTGPDIYTLTAAGVATMITCRTLWLLFRGAEWPVRKRFVSMAITVGLIALFNELLQRTL